MDGILAVDKPKGFTSHDVVDLIRKRFGIKKAGHAGTLDPMATGLLVILIGSFTKRSSEFLNHDKEYEATMTLGAESDTGDAWGRITDRRAGFAGTAADVEAVFRKFSGPMAQDVPAYSAKKINGKKLYQLARKGIEVKLEPKNIVIHSIEMTGFAPPEVSFKVRCSKGTYIRQLCMDIGSALGCGAYLSGLRRTACGDMKVSEAISVEEIKKLDANSINGRLKVL